MNALDRFKYSSRKFIRWFGAMFLVFAASTGISLVGLYSIPVATALVVISLASFVWGSRFSKGAAASIVDIVVALVATLLGVGKALSGATHTVWNPAKSR
jgi:fucose 4-O-acetylase-like acetyltransferase